MAEMDNYNSAFNDDEPWAECIYECGTDIYIPDGDHLEALDNEGRVYGLICRFCEVKHDK